VGVLPTNGAHDRDRIDQRSDLDAPAGFEGHCIAIAIATAIAIVHGESWCSGRLMDLRGGPSFRT
jgi:hypothetical protein